jgi:hypothetical protein
LSEDDEAPETLDIGRIGKTLERLKWYIWHGNVYQALKKIEYLEWDLEDWEDDSAAAKLLAAAQDSATTLKSTRTRSRIMVTGTATAKQSRHRSWNLPSIR